jgi:hypothetical protein
MHIFWRSIRFQHVALAIVILASTTLAQEAAGPVVKGVGFHISLQTLQQLDTLSSDPIEGLSDARAYVRKAAALCGTTDPSLVPDDLESRFAAAELDVAKDPSKLVSDDQIAEAFNLMSDEFQVPHPAHLTATDILQYRSVRASIFPHIFSPKTVGGSRPFGAIVMLYQLWFNGGDMEGVRKAAQLDLAPGSIKISHSGGSAGGSGGVINNNPNLIFDKEYQRAGYIYFAQRSPQQISSFLNRLAGIIQLPERR